MKKLWGGRFSAQTEKTVEDFTESVSFDARLWKYDIEGSIAHVTMLGRQKIISKKDAELILSKLSGNKHFVYTGFAIYNFSNNKLIVDYEKTTVYFIKLSNILIKDYIKTGSPMDKAGAYGIQEEFGSVFVKKVNGCYYNVMGLPLSKVYQSILSIK